MVLVILYWTGLPTNWVHSGIRLYWNFGDFQNLCTFECYVDFWVFHICNICLFGKFVLLSSHIDSDSIKVNSFDQDLWEIRKFMIFTNIYRFSAIVIIFITKMDLYVNLIMEWDLYYHRECQFNHCLNIFLFTFSFLISWLFFIFLVSCTLYSIEYFLNISHTTCSTLDYIPV